MPISYPYLRYGGIWTPSQQADAKAAGTWPSPPQPYLYSWGQNNQGQLGLGNTTYYSSPKQVGSLTNWLKIAAGYGSTFAIKTDGTLWSWGTNFYGQLGLGNTTEYSSPKQVGSLTNWLSVSSGFYNTAALKTDGTLWTWGYNNVGQLGLNNTTNYSSPKQVGSLTNWAKVSMQFNFCIAIKTDGTLWTWGRNQLGQLGLGNITYYSSPKQVGSLTNWSQLSFGLGQHALVIKTDGTLWAWGSNSLGRLGLGNTTNYSSPKQVGSLTDWASVANGMQYSFAIKTNNTLWSWGRSGASGTLGLGNTTDYSSPKQIGSLTNWLKVSAAYGFFALATKTDGTLWAWGFNGFGPLGLGNRTNYSSPKQVGSLTTWTDISAGSNQSIGIALN